MDERHSSHRFLEEPTWARGPRSTRRHGSGLDLSDLSGFVPAADVVRRAARNVSPLSATRPSAWMLREALAKTHSVDVGQVFPRASVSHLLTAIMNAFVGPDDHVALCAPCRPAFIHHVLVAGARYVDIGRDFSWAPQSDAFERLVSDGGLRAVLLGRPDIPTGTSSPLTAVRQALHAGLIVVVDETQLAYADPNAGLPRGMSPKADTALALLSDDGTPTEGLIVLRRIPGLGPGDLVYAVAEVETTSRLWRVDPVALIPAPIAAGAWVALDETAHARRIIVARCTVRSELRTALQALPGYVVTGAAGPCLLVQRPGSSGADLASALEKAELVVACSEHHSWRDAVALGIPNKASLDAVIKAFKLAAERLDAC